MKGSLIIVSFFVLGIIVGLCDVIPAGPLDSDVSHRLGIGKEINNPIHVFVLKSGNYIPVVYQIILEFMFPVACFK